MKWGGGRDLCGRSMSTNNKLFGVRSMLINIYKPSKFVFLGYVIYFRVALEIAIDPSICLTGGDHEVELLQ